MSGVSWNPNSAATKGLEAFLPTGKSFALDSFTKCLGMSLDQTVSQAIGTVKVPISAIPVRGGRYIVEVYDGEDGVPTGTAGVVTTLTARPNEDVTTTNWNKSTGANFYGCIDDTPQGDSDYINIYDGVGVYPYVGRMSTGSLSLTGKRIVSVRLKCYAGNSTSGGTLQLGLNIAGTDYYSGIFSGLPYNPNQVTSANLYTAEWKTNPATGQAWSIADVQAFDTTDEWSARSPGGAALSLAIVWMEVDIADVAENRLALGVLDDSTSGLTAGAWNAVTLLTPTAGTWTKDASGRHLYTLRRTSSIGSLVVPLLDGDALAFASGWQPTLDSTTGVITAMGDPLTSVFGLIQRTTAPADSVDSIPYVTQVEALVYTGQTAQQEFSNAAAVAYGGVRALVKPNGTAIDLTVKIKKRSDNSQLGSTLTFTAADVAELPDAGGGWKLITDAMSSLATLAAATQYYVEFASAAAGTGSDYWSVLAYDTWDADNTGGFGGTTDQATITTSLSVAAAEAARYDIPATLSQIPTAPSGADTTLETLTLTDGIGFAVASIDYVRASWTVTSLGATFDYYEVARSEDSGTTYVTIARIYDESTGYFDDIEGLRGVSATYRVREVITSGAVSAWTSCGSKTPTAASGALVFSSNWALSSSVAFKWANDPAPAWQSLETSTVREPYGVDGHYGFRGTERRYRSWSAVIFPVLQLSSTTRAGVGVFDPLDDFLQLSIPYVCVLDGRGNRWFADVNVGQELDDGIGNYRQAITVIELTRTPVPVQLTAVAA